MTIFAARVNNQKGQALLIVVLIMVVALTVTLSLVSRSVVNLKTTVDQSSSQQALSAAEAGIEQAIKNKANVSSNFDIGSNQTAYTAQVTDVVDDNGFLVNGGNLILKDEGAYVWLAGNPPTVLSPSWSGNLNIYWGDFSGDSKNAAIEVILITGADKQSAKTSRKVFDPYAARAGANNFSSASTAGSPYTVDGQKFKYSAAISITNGILMKIVPIYFSSYMAVAKTSGSGLPVQGQIITSSGCSPRCNSGSDNISNVKRKITVFQGYPQLPTEIFPYSLLSP